MFLSILWSFGGVGFWKDSKPFRLPLLHGKPWKRSYQAPRQLERTQFLARELLCEGVHSSSLNPPLKRHEVALVATVHTKRTEACCHVHSSPSEAMQFSSPTKRRAAKQSPPEPNGSTSKTCLAERICPCSMPVTCQRKPRVNDALTVENPRPLNQDLLKIIGPDIWPLLINSLLISPNTQSRFLCLGQQSKGNFWSLAPPSKFTTSSYERLCIGAPLVDRPGWKSGGLGWLMSALANA